MFHDLTGKSVLDEPHREVDKAAYALAREWTRFEPAYALGLATLRAERLFDPEQRLLYWPVFRPGVLTGRAAAWFAGRRDAIGGATDTFGTSVVALALAGVAIAILRRRWLVLSLLPFQLALSATYIVFFAEPRYRIPIEMLAFPLVALALVEAAAVLRATTAAVLRRDWARVRRPAPALAAAVAVALLAWRLGWPALVDGGAGLRARHRWAATEWLVDGRPRLCKWRPAGTLAPVSPIEAGAPGGLRVRAGAATPAIVEVELGGGDLPAGTYALRLRLEASGPSDVSFTLRGPHETATAVAAGGTTTTLATTLHHDGGPLHLRAETAGVAPSTIWLGDARLDPG
jgi:hypothetical protein